jgi:FG-GAP repeat.
MRSPPAVRRLLLALALAASGGGLRADESPGFVPQFSGPEITKLDWNTRAILARDLDGDGRVDLALINNDRAALELLFQRDPSSPASDAKTTNPGRRGAGAAGRWEPVLEDARFRRETVIVGQNLFDLVAGDFDGDGRPDLAATGEPAPLTIRFSREDGVWEEKTYATAPAPVKYLGCLAAADLDGDGLDDLVILGQREIAVFLQRPDLGLVLDEKIPLADDGAYGLLLRDIDGDSRPDLLYLVSGQREALRVRHQVAPGKFGPELAFGLKTPRSPLVPVLGEPSAMSGKTLLAASGKPGARSGAKGGALAKAAPDGPLFVSVLSGGGQLEFTRLVGAPGDDPWGGLAPRAFAPLAGARSTALYATGDFNGDGASDLAAAFGETAQIFVYLRQPGGGFTVPRRVSSLTDARAVGALAWKADRPADLLVLSGKENALASISLNPDGTATPARSLPIPGRLVTFAAGDLAPEKPTSPGATRPGLAVVAEEEGKRQLTLWTRDGDGALQRGASVVLAGLRTDPRAVFLHDIDQDGRADVLVAVPSVGMRVYLQKPDGTLADAADNPLYRPGLLARAEAANAPFAAEDVDGDGRAELLVGAENFIRALRLAPDGELVTVAQFDARDPGAEVTTGFVLPPLRDTGDDSLRVILHDRKNNQLHLLVRKPGEAIAETLDLRSVARLDVTGALRLAGPRGRRELLLLGKDRFWWMPEGAADFTLKGEGIYVSDLSDVRHAYVTAGDFDGDGRTDLVATDLGANLIELLSRDAHGDWTSRMHFKVFDADPHHDGGRGGQEPREAIVADITGDGRDDLVLLVHDRVLVYPQE